MRLTKFLLLFLTLMVLPLTATAEFRTAARTAVTIAGLPVMTSAQFATKISDETGSGLLVYGTTPNLIAPNIGSAIATQVSFVDGGSVDSDTAGTYSLRGFDSDDSVQRSLLTVTVGNAPYISFASGQENRTAFGFSNNGTISVAQQGTYATANCSGVLKSWDISVDAGTATVKFWKIASGTAILTSANSINTSGVSISSNTHIHSTTLSDFTTTTVTAGDTFAAELTAVSGVAKIAAQLNMACR